MFLEKSVLKFTKFKYIFISILTLLIFKVGFGEENFIVNKSPNVGNIYHQFNKNQYNQNIPNIKNTKNQFKSFGDGENENITDLTKKYKDENRNFNYQMFEKSDLEKEYESRLQGLNKNVKQFGYDFFQGKPVVNINAPVSKNYVIGIGDKLTIYIKNSEIIPGLGGALNLTVDKNGEIYIPEVGTFYVVGATLSEIEDLLTSAIGSPVSVSLSKLRGFTVYVSGEVYKPGAVQVSNLNTVLDALMLAGGVKKTGSLRNIVLTRTSGRKIKIDLYKLLVFGEPINIRLRDGDVILVKPIGKTVAIVGKVKRPAIYEIKGSEKIKDIIDLAGGLLPSAYKYKVVLQRYSSHKYMKIETGKLDDESFINKNVLSGDILEIKSIYNEPLNFVEIKGEVKYPGKYEYKERMRLSDLINYENIKLDTNLDYGEIERRDPFTFEIKEIITFSPRNILNGTKDITLQKMDVIRIFPRYTYKPIKVSGLIEKPYIVPYRDNLKLSEALFNAKFKENLENLVVEIYRLENFIKEEGKLKNEMIYKDKKMIYKDKDMINYKSRVNLNEKEFSNNFQSIKDNSYKGQFSSKEKEKKKQEEYITNYKFYKKVYLYDLLVENNLNSNIKLKPGDKLVIRKINKNDIVKKVYIFGYVNKPGVYDISKYPTLYDVLTAAGGFKSNAYPKGLILLREKVAKIQYEKLALAVNLMKQELLKEEAGLMRADITSSEQKGLEISYKARRKFLDTLKETQITGRISGIKVSYNLKELKNSPFNIKLENGDKIYVPPIPNDIYIFGEVFNPSTLIYMKGLTVEDYLKLAGGLTKYADKDNIFVIKADGTTISSQSSKSLINWNAKHKRFVWGGYYNDILNYMLEPGDAIIVPTEIKVPTMWRPLLKDVLQIIYQSILSAYMIKRL